MSELDRAKETIAYLKLWLGAMVVTDITLVGWLASNLGVAPTYRVAIALMVIIAIAYAVYRTHLNIERRIDALKEL